MQGRSTRVARRTVVGWAFALSFGGASGAAAQGTSDAASERDVRAIQTAMIDLYAGSARDSVFVAHLDVPLERSDDLRVLVFHAIPAIDAETLESFEEMVRVGEAGAPPIPADLRTVHPYRVQAKPQDESPGCSPRSLTIGPVGLSPSGNTAAVFSDHWAGPDVGAGVTLITFLRRVDGRWEKQKGVEAHLYGATC